MVPEAPASTSHPDGQAHNQKLKGPLRVEADLDAVINAAQAADAIAIASGGVQDAADMALIAHVLTRQARTPVLHAVSAGASTGFTAARTSLLRYADIAVAADEASGFHFDDAAASLYAAGAVSTRYSAVTYAGHAQPHTVVVAAGPGAATTAQVAAELASTGNVAIGVLTVTLLHPFPQGALRASLPRSVKKVVALSRGSGSASASAFLKLVQKALPTAVPLHLSGAFTATHASRLLHSAVLGGSIPASELAESVHLPLSSSQRSSQARLPPSPLSIATYDDNAKTSSGARQSTEGGLSYGFLGLIQDGSLSLGSSTLHVLDRVVQASVPLHVTQLNGTFDRGTATFSRVTVDSPAYSSDACDVLVLSHHALLTSFDVASLLKAGGTLIVNAIPAALPKDENKAKDGKEAVVEPAEVISGVLSSADEAALSRLGVRLLCLDGAALLSAAGLPQEALPQALQATAFAARGQSVFAQVSAALEAEQRAQLHLPASKTQNIVRLHRAVRAGLQALRLTPQLNSSRSSYYNKEEEHSRSKLIVPQPALLQAHGQPADGNSPSPLGPEEYKAARALVHAHAHSSAAAATLHAPFLSTAQSVARAALALTFPSAFEAQSVPMLENAEAVAQAGQEGAASAGHGHRGAIHTVKVTKNVRLTPLEYDRNIFHIEMDITGTGLQYEIGSALGVYATNDAKAVRAFLESYVPQDHKHAGLDPNTPVGLPISAGEEASAAGVAPPVVMVQTAQRLFTHELDLFGKPGKDFYEKLAKYATDEAQALELRFLGSEAAAGAAGYKAREAEGYTHADVLAEFTSARPPLAELVKLIPRIKARHYSIASSARAHPDSVHLLVVEVGWTTPKGRVCFGQASHFLATARIGSDIRVSVLPSEMRMPEDPMKPIVMAGLGTGMAPFRAFIQERASMAADGHKVGPVVLYMGSRHKAMEYLYGEELEAYAAAGVVTGLRLAFSRDGPRKVYIQHLMQEDSTTLYEYLHASRQGGSFYLCGPTWPEPDVEEAMTQAFAGPLKGAPSPAHPALLDAPGFYLPNTPPKARAHEEAIQLAKEEIKAMKEAKRYVLEVY